MRKYALVNNNVVTAIISFEEDEYGVYSKSNDLVVDITDIVPEPHINWVLNGNVLEIPSGNSSREEFEIALAEKKSEFGSKLAKSSIDKIGARNKILSKTGEQVAVVLNALLSIKFLLETGALGTARYSCSQVKLVYTDYADIFDCVIEQIDIFEANYGL